MYETNAILSKTFLFWYRAVYELWLTSYGPKHASWSLFDTPFCAYFKYNSKTTGCLQLYYTPNDSSTTEDALFHVKSCKAVVTYKLQLRANIAVLLFVRKYEWQQNSGRLQMYYNTVTTDFLPTLHLLYRKTNWGTTYELLSSNYRGVFTLHVGCIN